MRPFTAILIILAAMAVWDLGWWFGFGVSPLSPMTLKAALKDGNPPVMIDVRTPGEFEFFHIPGAINVPFPASLADFAKVSPDPEQPVVVVCMSGHRSPPVVKQMQDGGYTNVRNLTWGMLAWKLFGGETVSGR